MSDDTQTENFDVPLHIELNRGTVVVLGAFLESLADKLLAAEEIDQPQVMALWHLVNAIESVCVDSFRPDYPQILAAAKKSMGKFE